jgi:hypothetical protein
LLERVAITAVLNRPAGATESLVEAISHGVCPLSVELRLGWALRISERLVAHGSKVVVVVGGLGRVLDLALEGVETVGQFFDVAKASLASVSLSE